MNGKPRHFQTRPIDSIICPMRVYLPETMADLEALVDHQLISTPYSVYAATPQARERHGEWVTEHRAKYEAAFGSLRILFAYPSLPRRRVVIVAEVPDDEVEPTPRVDAPCTVHLTRELAVSDIVFAYVDDHDAEGDVAIAAEGIPGVDLGSMDEINVAAADRHEMRRYAAHEFPDKPWN